VASVGTVVGGYPVATSSKAGVGIARERSVSKTVAIRMTTIQEMAMSDSPPGLYLVNASGEMIPVHTANDSDQQLLREYLQEWDIPHIEVVENNE